MIYQSLLLVLLVFTGFVSDAQDSIRIKVQQTTMEKARDSAYQARISFSELDGHYIPLDLLDCFKELNKIMEPSAKEAFMEIPDSIVDARTHGMLGLYLNKRWSIAEGSRLTAYFRKMKVPHYDYMIGIIIQSYHRYLHGRPLEVREQVAYFNELWEVKKAKKFQQLLDKQ